MIINSQRQSYTTKCVLYSKHFWQNLENLVVRGSIKANKENIDDDKCVTYLKKSVNLIPKLVTYHNWKK